MMIASIDPPLILLNVPLELKITLMLADVNKMHTINSANVVVKLYLVLSAQLKMISFNHKNH